MPLTDISLLFKDIIETPQQKRQRLFTEGQAAAGQYTGLPTGLRELAMGTASGIPNMVESIRQFGAGVGLPVQTQGEQMQGAMANFNVDDPNSRMAVYRQLRDIDPMRAIAFGEMLKDRDSQQATAAEEARLRGLQIENEIATKQARRDAQLFERTQTLRAQEEITTRRSSMIDMASESDHLSLDEKAQIEEFITGGGYDDNAEDFFARAMPESDWKPIGENNYYDPVTKTWLIVPANRAGGNLGATSVLERFAISARIYDPGSMARLNTEIARINNIEGLSTVERFALEEEGVNTLLPEQIFLQ